MNSSSSEQSGLKLARVTLSLISVVVIVAAIATDSVALVYLVIGLNAIKLVIDGFLNSMIGIVGSTMVILASFFWLLALSPS